MENMELNQLKSIFSGKKVLLTGHTGFKGSWFLVLLNQLGAEVKGYALSPIQNPDLYSAVDGYSICQSKINDIRNLNALKASVKAFQPDFVFHFAAQALVLESYKNPVDTFSTNVMGTVNMLEALKEVEKLCVSVIITTDKVYENMEREAPYQEDERLGGFDPYSNSKACSELVTSSFINSFFNPKDFGTKHHHVIATARSGNVIGGGDWSENRIIPDLIRALEAEEPLHVRNPNATRPWQHVLDPLFGYLTLAAYLQEHKNNADFLAFNFGPEPSDVLTVEHLIKKALSIYGTGTYQNNSSNQQPHEAKLLMLDIQRAKATLHWKPRLNAENAITWTINWYKDFNQNNAKEVTEQQIADYLALS